MSRTYKKHKSLEPEWINSSGQEIDIDNQEGFIYLITNKINGMKYIGRKYLWARSRKKVPGRVYRKRTKKESDWKTYWGSCEPLHADYFKYGIENFEREILSIHARRADVCYEEAAAQFAHDVLRAKDSDGNFIYYNTNIGSKYFRRSDESYDAAAEKISKSLKEGFSSGKIKHPMQGKEHPNKGKKINSGHQKSTVKYALKDPQGCCFVGENLTDLCRRYGLDPSSLAKVNKGKLKSHKGWKKI